MYYSKTEYNQMKRSLESQINRLKKENEKLKAKLHVTKESDSNE